MPPAGAERVLLVGAGRMGGALLTGWVEGENPLLAPASVHILDPTPGEAASALSARHGIALSAEPADGLAPDVLVLAVKPQAMSGVLERLAPKLTRRPLVLSIAAGIPIATLESVLGPGPVIRAMPNTPAAIGRGISAVVANGDADARARDLAARLLEAVGAVAWVEEEVLMDAVTAVSGSGPAYIFLLAECLAEAGVAAGLPPDLAERLARATVSGSGALLDARREPAATLREEVTSPGGTTEAALRVLRSEKGLAPLLTEAVLAARDRSRALRG